VFGLVGGEWGPAEGVWAGSGAMEASRHEHVIFPTPQNILGGKFGCNFLVPAIMGLEAKVTISGSLHLSSATPFSVVGTGQFLPPFVNETIRVA
jgi:hypothetical protein